MGSELKLVFQSTAISILFELHYNNSKFLKLTKHVLTSSTFCRNYYHLDHGIFGEAIMLQHTDLGEVTYQLQSPDWDEGKSVG